MMRGMTEGPGQQPAQEPRDHASEAPREVLEGRVIPSRSSVSDPRQGFAAPPEQPARPEEAADGAPAQTDPYGVLPGQPAAWQQPQQPPGQGGGYGFPQQQVPPQPGGPTPAGAQAPLPARSADQAPAQGGIRGARPGPQTPPQGGGYGFPQQQAPQAAQGRTPQQPPGQGGGYGFPQQQVPRQSPAGAGAGGYGFPRPATENAQGPSGPGGAGPRPAAADTSSGTPDWSALAEEQAASGRRRKVLMVAGGILAVAVIAGGVAAAVVHSGKGKEEPIAGPSGSASTTGESPLPPQPSFSSVAPPPPANPLDFISTAAKDKAPITAASLFPGKQFTINGATYTKTASVSTKSCAAAARSTLSGALAANGCTQMVRATYTNGQIAVTVGIAVFPDKAHAAKVHNVAQYVAPLNGGGITDFCHAVACQMTSNAVGRYAYFAIAGYKDGKTLPNATVGKQDADNASDFAFQRIVQRGRDAAQAAQNGG
jgi:hypothetical protein